MPPRIRLIFSSMSVTLLLIAAVPLYRELSKPKDIWWTPPTMLVPLPESQDRAQIYVHGKLLGSLLEAGQLRITEERGATVLQTRDIGVRFNNWDRVRAAQLPMMLGFAVMCGAMLMLLILTATGSLVYRGEKERVAA